MHSTEAIAQRVRSPISGAEGTTKQQDQAKEQGLGKEESILVHFNIPAKLQTPGGTNLDCS